MHMARASFSGAETDSVLRDSLRFSIDDSGGSPCFEAVEFVGIPDHERINEALRKHFVGRSLTSIHVPEVKKLLVAEIGSDATRLLTAMFIYCRHLAGGRVPHNAMSI